MKLILIGINGKPTRFVDSFKEGAEIAGCTVEEIKNAYETGTGVNDYCIDRLITERDMTDISKILVEIRSIVESSINKVKTAKNSTENY